MKVADAAEELVFLQDKEVTIQRITIPTELSPGDNDIPELIPEDKSSQANNTDEFIPKSKSTSGVVILVGLGAAVLFVLWRLRSVKK